MCGSRQTHAGGMRTHGDSMQMQPPPTMPTLRQQAACMTLPRQLQYIRNPLHPTHCRGTPHAHDMNTPITDPRTPSRSSPPPPPPATPPRAPSRVHTNAPDAAAALRHIERVRAALLLRCAWLMLGDACRLRHLVLGPLDEECPLGPLEVEYAVAQMALTPEQVGGYFPSLSPLSRVHSYALTVPLLSVYTQRHMYVCVPFRFVGARALGWMRSALWAFWRWSMQPLKRH